MAWPSFSLGLKKRAFAFYDKPNQLLNAAKLAQLAQFEFAIESQHKKVEDLLAAEVALDIQRQFLEEAKDRSDYPNTKKYAAGMTDPEVLALTKEVLTARKGEASGYAAILIEHCKTDQNLPKTIKDILIDVHARMLPPSPAAAPAPTPCAPTDGSEDI